MSQETSAFTQIINDVDTMSEEQRRTIADGHEDDESFTISADDYASADEFQAAVVAEIMRLLDLG